MWACRVWGSGNPFKRDPMKDPVCGNFDGRVCLQTGEACDAARITDFGPGSKVRYRRRCQDQDYPHTITKMDVLDGTIVAQLDSYLWWPIGCLISEADWQEQCRLADEVIDEIIREEGAKR